MSMYQSDVEMDILSVSVSKRATVPADGAKLSVQVTGASAISSKIALNKAKEVEGLINSLRELGLGESDIEVTHVSFKSASGSVFRSSECSYGLLIRCNDLNQMPGILGVVADQKNAELGGITWIYSQSDQWDDGLTEQAVAEAVAKATRLAGALGVELLGVHRFGDDWDRYRTTEEHLIIGFTEPPQRGQTSPSLDFGVPLSHSREQEVTVELRYRISPCKVPAANA